MITLRDDDRGVLPELVLSKQNGFIISMFEPGFPEIREDSQPRVQANGAHEYTKFYGAATVNLEAMIYPPAGTSRQELVDMLARYCHPAARAYIHWSLNDDGGVSRCMMIRGSRMSRPVQAWNRRSVQCQWIAPKGVQESSVRHLVAVPVSASQGGTGSTTGRSYPLDYPRNYGSLVAPTGTTNVPNAGNETAYPIIRVWGAITDPEIINVTTGQRFKFTTTVPAGNYLEIDTLTHTVYLNGDLLYSKYGTMDNAISTWWGLAPGDNLIGLVASAYTGEGIRADFYYRDAWI